MSEPRFVTEAIADFALRVGADDLDSYAADRLKRSLLDAIGCALGALEAPPVVAIRGLVDEFGGSGLVTMIGGGRTAPDRAVLVNGCLVRYVDFMDNIASKGEVCHPSDNIAALLAAGEHAGASGQDLLLAMAVKLSGAEPAHGDPADDARRAQLHDSACLSGGGRHGAVARA